MIGRRPPFGFLTLTVLVALALLVPSAFAASCGPTVPPSGDCGCQDGGAQAATRTTEGTSFAAPRSADTASEVHLRFASTALDGPSAVLAPTAPATSSLPPLAEPALQAAAPALFLSHCAFLC